MLMQIGINFAQQSFPAKAINDMAPQSAAILAAGAPVVTPYRFGIYGIGNINEQALTQINVGGKLSCFFIPYEHVRNVRTFITNICPSFNVNATNKDTLLEGTILFPDLGNAAFLGTVEAGYIYDRSLTANNRGFKYYYGLLGEFAAKKISMKNSDTSVYFNVLSYIGGFKATIYYQPTATDPVYSFSILAYYNFVHIPDNDDGDYRYILKQPNLSGSLNSAGVKISVGINNLTAFADMRHTFYNGTEVVDRGLYSFNCNVGIILPVQIKTNAN